MSSCTDSPRVEGGGEEEQNVYLACILLDENPYKILYNISSQIAHSC